MGIIDGPVQHKGIWYVQTSDTSWYQVSVDNQYEQGDDLLEEDEEKEPENSEILHEDEFNSLHNDGDNTAPLLGALCPIIKQDSMQGDHFDSTQVVS